MPQVGLEREPALRVIDAPLDQPVGREVAVDAQGEDGPAEVGPVAVPVVGFVATANLREDEFVVTRLLAHRSPFDAGSVPQPEAAVKHVSPNERAAVRRPPLFFAAATA